MLFQIKGRWDGFVKCEVEITCAHNASYTTQLSKAVIAAISQGADLGGADGKSVGKARKLIGSALCVYTGYFWTGFLLEDGTLRIWAGCRQAFTLEQFCQHIAKSYPDTRKAAEVGVMVDFFEAAWQRELAAQKGG